MVSLQIAYSAGPDLPPHQPSGGSPQQSRPPRESGRGAARPWLWTATPGLRGFLSTLMPGAGGTLKPKPASCRSGALHAARPVLSVSPVPARSCRRLRN